MPQRPKRPVRSRRSSSEHDFAVVLETLQGNFRVYGDALQGFRAEVGARFDQVGTHLDGIDIRLDGIDIRLDGIDTRLGGIDTRLAGIDGDVGLLKDAVLANTRELKHHGRQLDELRAAVARKIERDDLEA